MKTGTDIPDLHRWMTYGRPLFVCIIMASFAVLLGAEPSAEGATHSRQPVATEGQVIASVYPAAGTEDEVEEWYAYVYQYRRRTGGGQSNWEVCGRGLPGPECLTDHPADDTEPSLNYGATEVAFVSNRDGNAEIYKVNTDGSTLTRLTYHPAEDNEPSWSPDNESIAFISRRSGRAELYVMDKSGGNVRKVSSTGGQSSSPSWSPDSRSIVWAVDNRQLWIANSDGTNQRMLGPRFNFVAHPAWSPAGDRIAFEYDAEGDGFHELALIHVDGTGFQKTNYLGGLFGADITDLRAPAWTPGAKWLFFSARFYYLGRNGTANHLDNDDLYVANVAAGPRYAPYYDVAVGSIDHAVNVNSNDIWPPIASLKPLPPLSYANGFTVQVDHTPVGPAPLLNSEVQWRAETSDTWREFCFGCVQLPIGVRLHFRVRATDRAGNTGDWSDPNEAVTILYADTTSARVIDNRGIPHNDSWLEFEPPAVLPVRSNATGEFRAYLVDEYFPVVKVALQKPGYGAMSEETIYYGPTEPVARSGFYSFPHDNVVVNGEFNSPQGPLYGWTVSDASVVQVNDVACSFECVQICTLEGTVPCDPRTHPVLPSVSEAAISQVVHIDGTMHRPTLAGGWYFFLPNSNGQLATEPEFYIDITDSITRTRVLTGSEFELGFRMFWIDMEPWQGQTVTLTIGTREGITADSKRFGGTLHVDAISLGSWSTPQIEDFAPTHIEPGVRTTLQITGSNFIATPEVFLGDIKLESTHWIDEFTLEATVPESIGPGSYDLLVVNPQEQSAVRPNAIVIGTQTFFPNASRKARTTH